MNGKALIERVTKGETQILPVGTGRQVTPPTHGSDELRRHLKERGEADLQRVRQT